MPMAKMEKGSKTGPVWGLGPSGGGGGEWM
jgi:hypothetical protein